MERGPIMRPQEYYITTEENAQAQRLAAVYMRMSTDKQEHSIEGQWRLLQEWADRNHYQIIQRYEDAGLSAMESKLSKRTDFLRMIEESESSAWRTVLIYDSSRFSRSLKDSIVYKSILRQNGVQLISITEPVLDDDSSLMVDALNGAMNEMYIRKLSKNVRRGQEQKVIRGEVFSKPPFGYRRPFPSSPFVIVEEEAQIVRYIYESYASGRTTYSLATELAQTAIRTRHGNPFDTRQIERILTNPIYKGWMDVTINGKRYCQLSNHPAIISPEEFDRMQELFSIRQRKRGKKQKPREKHTHWLSGKVRCAQCGGSYFRRQNGHGHNPSFICSNYAKGKCIKPPMITEPVLEKLFLEALERFFTSDDLYRIELITPVSPVTEDFDGQIQKLERALVRAKEAFLAEVDTLEEYKANKAALEKQMADCRERKEKAHSPEPDIPATRERAKSLYKVLTDPSSTLEDRQQLMESLVERITVYPDRSISVTLYSS